jgi:hypothetical protein
MRVDSDHHNRCRPVRRLLVANFAAVLCGWLPGEPPSISLDFPPSERTRLRRAKAAPPPVVLRRLQLAALSRAQPFLSPVRHVAFVSPV